MDTIVWSRSQWIALLSLSFAVFMVSLDVTVVVVSLPRIQAELGLTLAQLQWVVTAYSLTLAGCLLSAGVLADRYGRRSIFFVGLTLFALSSGAAGLAGGAALLNLARGVQGLGAALMLSSSGALLAQTFPGADRTRAFGVWGAVVGIGLAFGPLIGGLITRHIDWHWIFLINLPVAALIYRGVLRTVSGSFSSVKRHLDWPGMLTFSGALFGLVYALSSVHPGAAQDRATIASALAGVLLLLAFSASQRWQAAPMIDLALLPLTLPMLLLPTLSARLALRMPRHLHFGMSLALNGAGAGVILLGLHSNNGLMMLGMALSGSGAGMINAQMTNVAVSVVAAEHAGMATGISGTMRQAGFVFAIAIHTLMIEQAGDFVRGLEQVLLSSMAAAAVAALIGLFWLRQQSAAPHSRKA